MDFLVWLEQTSIGTWVRESPTIWAYPTVLFLHTLGLGIVVGVSSAVDVRILGFASGVPLTPLKKLFPLMWVGFGINAFSGTLLLIADASTKLINPVFWVKMILIALAVVTIQALNRQVFQNPLIDQIPMPMNGKILAGISLLLWACAVTAGRLMAYIGPVSGLQ